MTEDEMAMVLGTIAAFDRKPFPAGAETAWMLLLGDVALADAMTAVRDHYATSGKAATPGDIRAKAIAAREARERSERRALSAAPVACNPEVRARAMAEIRAITARFADLDRAPSQRNGHRVPADVPVRDDVDTAALDAERERQLRLLASLPYAS